jgi:hypothetical protein
LSPLPGDTAPYDDTVTFLQTQFATGRRYDAYGATWWQNLPPCYNEARESAGGQLLGPLELVEAEQGELAGDHPREGVQRVGDPVLVGHDCNSLERRTMLNQGTKAQF